MNYPNNGISIGKNIREVRERKNWSQKDLERKSGIVNTQISAYETGKKEPTLHTLATLASALGVTMDELYWGDVNEAFINSAPDKGRQIVNSLYKLRELGVVSMNIKSNGLDLKKHWTPIQRFMESLNEFDYVRDTYSDPDSYLAMLKDSISLQINQEIDMREKTKGKVPVAKATNNY